MDSKRQFSLTYLLFLVFAWALALGLTRQYWLLVRGGESYPLVWIILAGLACCVAIGGTFLKMRFGLRLAVRMALPMVGCLLWLNGTFGYPRSFVTLAIVLVASGLVEAIADAAADAYRRRVRVTHQE